MEKSICCFIDILGYKDIICNSTDKENDFSSLNIKENNSFILTKDDTKVTIDLPLIL